MPKDKGIQVNGTLEGESPFDIKVVVQRDTDGKISQGVVVGDTLRQNQAIILMAYPGDLKFTPTLGVGIGDALLGDELLESRHKIRKEFAKDGMTVTKLDLYNDKPITIDAQYTS